MHLYTLQFFAFYAKYRQTPDAALCKNHMHVVGSYHVIGANHTMQPCRQWEPYVIYRSHL